MNMLPEKIQNLPFEDLSFILPVVFLFINSITDIRTRRICPFTLPLFLVTGIIFRAMPAVTGFSEYSDVLFPVLISMIPGAALFLAALLSGGSIGMGDGIAVIMLGLFHTAGITAAVLFISLALSAAVSGCLMIFKKKKRKDTVPFIPFLLAGEVICMAAVLAGS